MIFQNDPRRCDFCGLETPSGIEVLLIEECWKSICPSCISDLMRQMRYFISVALAPEPMQDLRLTVRAAVQKDLAVDCQEAVQRFLVNAFRNAWRTKSVPNSNVTNRAVFEEVFETVLNYLMEVR